MAVVAASGFEGGAVAVDRITLNGTAAYDTGTVRTGSRSIRCNPASGALGSVGLTATPWAAGYFHFALRIASMPSVTRHIAGDGTGTPNTTLNLRSDGTLEYKLAGVTIGSGVVGSAVLTTGQWYWIGVRTTAGTTVPTVQVNGVTDITSSPTTSPFSNVGCAGTEASAIDLFLDDMVTDDAGFLAPSKVDTLLPISDNARAALWTGGTGGTTNLWDAVNNTPPVGTATETNTTQIEHAGGAAGSTDAYDANMESYSTVGVNTGDTVLAVQLVAVHGEDVSTGAKLLAFSIVSNPAVATSGNVTAGDSTPAALGTYPTEWGHHFGTLTTSPSVTLGTSPVMRALRPETATRVASVCFMGIIVAWTPAAAARVPRSTPYPQLLAH